LWVPRGQIMRKCLTALLRAYISLGLADRGLVGRPSAAQREGHADSAQRRQGPTGDVASPVMRRFRNRVMARGQQRPAKRVHSRLCSFFASPASESHSAPCSAALQVPELPLRRSARYPVSRFRCGQPRDGA